MSQSYPPIEGIAYGDSTAPGVVGLSEMIGLRAQSFSTSPAKDSAAGVFISVGTDILIGQHLLEDLLQNTFEFRTSPTTVKCTAPLSTPAALILPKPSMLLAAAQVTNPAIL